MRVSLADAYETFSEEGAGGLLRGASWYLTQAAFSLTHGREYNKRGTNVFDEDWDNLLILDACRYDLFAQYNEIPGRLEARTSRGSMSREFVHGNFHRRHLDDTVYVTSNYWYAKLQEEIDTRVHHYHECERDAFDGLVTHPTTVTEAAIDHERRYPNKRLLVHYFQPHGPYFTEDGAERFRFPTDGYDDCRPADIREAYVQNLQLVLSEAERLVETLDGKTVISSDHGELLGERLPPFPVRQYQHPAGIYVDTLTRVPWHVIESDERKEIVSEPPETDHDRATTDVDEQLQALGYQ